MEGKLGSECLLKSVSNIDFNPFKAGQEIKYSISEDKVTGYKTTVSGYDLTNILNESSTPVKNQSRNTKKS